jgi:hypothetical protein
MDPVAFFSLEDASDIIGDYIEDQRCRTKYEVRAIYRYLDPLERCIDEGVRTPIWFELKGNKHA